MTIGNTLIDLLKPYFGHIVVDYDNPHDIRLKASGLREDAPAPSKAKRYYVLELRTHSPVHYRLMYQTDTRSMAESFISKQLEFDSNLGSFIVVCGREMVKKANTSVTLEEN